MAQLCPFFLREVFGDILEGLEKSENIDLAANLLCMYVLQCRACPLFLDLHTTLENWRKALLDGF